MGSYLSSEEQPVTQEDEVSSRISRMSFESQSLQPKRLRKPPVTILNEILKEKVKMNEADIRENNAILKNFLDTFIPVMKEVDPVFNALYQRIYYTGSYYSDLRVSKPDEYDLNLVLKLPFKSASITYHPQVPSYGKYCVAETSLGSVVNGIRRLFENGYLIPDKVRKWMQSVVDRAVTVYRPPREVDQVKCRAAGPARTIILVKRNGEVIDIDLVPVIECSLGLKPPGIHGLVFEMVKNHLQCFLVPKPYQPTRQAPVNELERSRLWRTHYPEAESKIIHDVGCVKPIIKLLKLLRDKENWSVLASYYLKTVLLWMVYKNSSGEYWKMDRIGERFLEALRILAGHVRERKIPYFFSSRYNLLEKLNEPQASNIYNRLCYFIREIERDYQNLWKVFGCPETFTM